MPRKLLRGIALTLACGWLAACASTPGPVIVHDATVMRAAVATVRDQTRTAFDATNKVARDQAIDGQVLTAKPLAEAAFPAAIAPADAAAWADALDILDAYAAGLQRLSGPDQAAATGTALDALGNELATGTTKVAISPGLQGLGVAFGKALVQAHGEAEATAAMRRTDPAFQALVAGMADAIGASPAPGTVQFTVKSNWDAALGLIQAQHQALIPPIAKPETLAKSEGDRRKLVIQFVADMESRDAQLRQLAQLHDALLAVGQVHAAAAKGKPGDAAFWVTRLSGWADDVKAYAQSAQKAQSEAAK